ncbi:MAG: O-antigen ligase family protein [Terracidiphilus sp.]|jgi:O-antigen ligase
MQQIQAVHKRPASPTAQWRLRPDEIGTSLTMEELLNLFMFLYLALNGIYTNIFNLLQMSYGSIKIASYLVTVSFWTLTSITFFRNRTRIHWELWTCRFAFVFLVYGLASVAWGTVSITVMLVPSITGICTFLYYNYLIDRFSLNDFTRMLVWAFGFLLVTSIILSVAYPSVGLDNGSSDMDNAGSWQGCFSQKNLLGITAALAFAVSVGLRPKSDVDRLWRWVVILSALVCSYYSQSRESWIAIGFQVIFFLLMRTFRNIQPRSRFPILVTGLGAFAIAVALVFYNLDAALALIGRTRTLSHRTDLWEATILLIRKRPWFGYGTYGVWNTPNAWTAVVRERWNVTSSHNNYLEVLLSYGIVGLALYLPIIGSALLYIFRALMSYDLRDLEVPIYVMITILILSMAVPLIMYSPSIGMVLMLYGVSQLERVERSGFMRLRS